MVKSQATLHVVTPESKSSFQSREVTLTCSFVSWFSGTVEPFVAFIHRNDLDKGPAPGVTSGKFRRTWTCRHPVEVPCGFVEADALSLKPQRLKERPVIGHLTDTIRDRIPLAVLRAA